jgi:hypothetical protein
MGATVSDRVKPDGYNTPVPKGRGGRGCRGPTACLTVSWSTT